MPRLPRRRRGSIPARAGSTPSSRGRRPCPGVHPRACGEHAIAEDGGGLARIQDVVGIAPPIDTPTTRADHVGVTDRCTGPALTGTAVRVGPNRRPPPPAAPPPSRQVLHLVGHRKELRAKAVGAAVSKNCRGLSGREEIVRVTRPIDLGQRGTLTLSKPRIQASISSTHHHHFCRRLVAASGGGGHPEMAGIETAGRTFRVMANGDIRVGNERGHRFRVGSCDVRRARLPRRTA